MNVFTFSGNLGRDCKPGNSGGTSVVNFTVAVKSGYGQNEQTLWLDCALWGKRGDSLQQYLVKGQQVVVSGELGTREYEGKTYLTCRVNDISLVGGKPQGGGGNSAGQHPQGNQSQQSAPAGSSNQGGDNQQGHDDDIPF